MRPRDLIKRAKEAVPGAVDTLKKGTSGSAAAISGWSSDGAEGLSNGFNALKDKNAGWCSAVAAGTGAAAEGIKEKTTEALSSTVHAVKSGNVAKMAKEALPNTIDTLKGEKGPKAQVYAWSTVAMAGAGVAVAGVAAAPLMAVGIVVDVVGGTIQTHNAVKKDETKKSHEAEIDKINKAHEAEINAYKEKLKASEKRKGPAGH